MYCWRSSCDRCAADAAAACRLLLLMVVVVVVWPLLWCCPLCWLLLSLFLNTHGSILQVTQEQRLRQVQSCLFAAIGDVMTVGLPATPQGTLVALTPRQQLGQHQEHVHAKQQSAPADGEPFYWQCKLLLLSLPASLALCFQEPAARPGRNHDAATTA
jgi:hypothetical protein